MPANDQYRVQRLLEQAILRLKEVSDSPGLDAEILLAMVLEKPRSYLVTWPEKIVEPSDRARFEQVLQRRIQGEPIAHITGEREFWSLPLKVTPDTLIPRPDTELLVELALASIPRGANWKILDLGTGTGAIALAIAQERPDAHVHAVERSEQALKIARENAARHSITNLQFYSGSWFEPVHGKRFHLIVSNPPYIASDDPHLQQGDVRFEPRTALVAGPEGMDDLEQIIRHAPGYLLPGGGLLLEHGYEQAAAVRRLLKMHGFIKVSTQKDLAGHDRVSCGYLPE